jgi:hypothetical protein
MYAELPLIAPKHVFRKSMCQWKSFRRRMAVICLGASFFRGLTLGRTEEWSVADMICIVILIARNMILFTLNRVC